MIDLALAAKIAGIIVLTVFLAGVVDIGRNGPKAQITRKQRRAAGSKDTGPVVFLVLAATASWLVLSGAVSIGADDNGPTLDFSTEPLLSTGP